jgi:UDP-N-acetylmuramoylalanine--D-glutamate ligase
MLELIRKKAGNNRIVILGFGIEGQSTLRYLLDKGLKNPVVVADKNAQILQNDLIKSNPEIAIISGDDYLAHLKTDDFIIKSPGVALQYARPELKNHSQTSLFLEQFGAQTIGITGTKGKSTTSTMIYRILKEQEKDAVLVGNIGLPAFDFLPKISDETMIVYELSAHQLQCVSHGPHQAILLNLMPEHLDFFGEVDHYYRAKCHIFSSFRSGFFAFANEETITKAPVSIPNPPKITQQTSEGIFLDNTKILGSEELKYLAGKHHINNIVAVIELVLYLNLSLEKALESIRNFKPLPHRQELLGEKHGLRFINDSISTIPQSAIYAVKAFEKIDYLIIGGFDRGIDYTSLVDFLSVSTFRRVYFLGASGERILKALMGRNTRFNFGYSWHPQLQNIKNELLGLTEGTVLLSPAAASYDAFSNFEERGNYFRQIFLELG